MTTFLQRYKRANLVSQCLPDMPIPDIGLTNQWALDAEMRESFKLYLEQYEQGVIHSMELVYGLLREVNKVR